MALPTTQQITTFGAFALTFAAGGVTFAASIHLLSAGDAASATGAFAQIGDGVTKVITGVTTLAGISAGVWAAWKASPFRQILAVNALPEVKGVITVPTPDGRAIADAAPAGVVAAGTSRAAEVAGTISPAPAVAKAG